jgi:hypothetical protein
LAVDVCAGGVASGDFVLEVRVVEVADDLGHVCGIGESDLAESVRFYATVGGAVEPRRGHGWVRSELMWLSRGSLGSRSRLGPRMLDQYARFFTASTGASAGFIGLLFVAFPLATSRSTPQGSIQRCWRGAYFLRWWGHLLRLPR